MQEYDLIATEHALSMYHEKVRQCLGRRGGYECQEADGEFMLAFPLPMQAVQFCLEVRRSITAYEAVCPCVAVSLLRSRYDMYLTRS